MLCQLQRNLRQKLHLAGELMWPAAVLEKLRKKWTWKVQLLHLPLSAAWVAFPP